MKCEIEIAYEITNLTLSAAHRDNPSLHNNTRKEMREHTHIHITIYCSAAKQGYVQ